MNPLPLAVRKQRLAMAIKKLRGDETQEQLAARTGGGGEGVSKRTIAGIESGDRTPSRMTLNKLDDAFSLPIGTLSDVFDGKIKDIDEVIDGSGRAVDDNLLEVRGQAYTPAEIRVLARALGAEGLYAWATGSLASADASDEATG